MSNLRILARNVADRATITANPVAVSTLPVTNLQLMERKRVFRTTSAASQDIKLTWSANQTINMVALCRNNHTSAMTMRIQLFSDTAWTTSIFDSGALSAFSFSGLSSIDDLTEYDFRMFKNAVLYFAQQTTVKSAIVTIADAANPDGYFEAARLMMGQYFETTYNVPQGGADLTLDSLTTSDRSDGGSLISNKGEKLRRLVFNLEWVADADVATLMAIARYLDTDKDCFISLYPGLGTAKEMYNMMRAKIKQSATFNPVLYALHKTALTFEEA